MYTLKNQVYSRSRQKNHNGTTSSQNRNAINGVDCVEGKIVYSLNGSLDLNNITMILCNYSINTITIINCEWNDWMVLSYKSLYEHVIVIKRCTNNGDCPRDKPIGVNRFCIGNKEYRKYTYTKTLYFYYNCIYILNIHFSYYRIRPRSFTE